MVMIMVFVLNDNGDDDDDDDNEEEDLVWKEHYCIVECTYMGSIACGKSRETSLSLSLSLWL